MLNIILHNSDIEKQLIAFSWRNGFLRQMLLDELGNMSALTERQECRFFLPAGLNHIPADGDIRYYEDAITFETSGDAAASRYVLLNGRYLIDYDAPWLQSLIIQDKSCVHTVMIHPDLKAYKERARITSDGRLTGFYRNYSDLARRAPVPENWPHLVIIPQELLTGMPTISHDFRTFLQSVPSDKLKCLALAGNVLDLAKERDYLQFFNHTVATHFADGNQFLTTASDSDTMIHPSVRVYGNVIVGRHVQIEENATIIGPTYIGDHVSIRSDTVVKNCVILENLSISRDTTIKERFVSDPPNQTEQVNTQTGRAVHNNILFPRPDIRERFHIWPWYSYAGVLKRIFDIIFAAVVLFCFVPFFIIIALLIKITDPGPIFFQHKRQGRYGKEFGCLKFRTMIVGADSMQQMLKKISQVDGPQFKIDDDPRVSTIGRFLRDTSLDEIPQFINVLRGEMSVIGPRPSPAKENTLCPYWRDIRLSVRPGITGQWQIYRSRTEGRDFQEWIHYDTEYVRNLSLWQDIKICFKTILVLARDFIRKF